MDKVEMLRRFRGPMLATARRYSANVHDADDAYQRAAVILLTHDPSGSPDDLCRWLRTTVKHEAIAIRHRQERLVPAGGADRVPLDAANPADTEARAERFERLRTGARALAGLKPQEARCLLLRAEGYSYREISERTGFSYTKVNRCLTEGRRAFARQVAAIEAASWPG
jgi:RNA polymerase sigma factor (sigma-70 family)